MTPFGLSTKAAELIKKTKFGVVIKYESEDFGENDVFGGQDFCDPEGSDSFEEQNTAEFLEKLLGDDHFGV